MDSQEDRKTESKLVQVRRGKADWLREEGIDPFYNVFRPSHTSTQVLAEAEGMGEEALARGEGRFAVAGRVVAVRSFGKAAFVVIQDREGRIQAHVRKDQLEEGGFEVFQRVDVGDFIGVEGGVFRTRTGEITLKATALVFLTKSLRPLPEKFHWMTDPELKYRQRYLDLIGSPESAAIFRRRFHIIRTIRSFFDQRGFAEVETPMMQVVPGGAAARPFQTHHNALGLDLYLRIAPELYLKRLLVAGFERVYEINRNFRNEGISTHHNPEFTMLEFYQAYATYEDLMSLTEELFGALTEEQGGEVELQGQRISLRGPFKRIAWRDSLIELGGVPEDVVDHKDKLAALVDDPKIRGESLGKIQAKVFDLLVEPKLLAPTFVVDFPIEISPLSRRKAGHPELADRFEFFLGGLEVANGFSELNDPDDQRGRFEDQMRQRLAGDVEAQPLDEDFLRALEHGMPPAAGEGIGIDRLVMVLTGATSIRDVILFPLMRPEGE